MKSITFYSYKGGVGRSLALSNIAIKLSEYKKKVCIIDFDLEAPGLHFKFRHYKRTSEIKSGIVDYIHDYVNMGIDNKNFESYSILLEPENKQFEPIHLIPAGNIDDYAYWRKLSAINWSGMFNNDNLGISFFLDLKQKIKDTFNPDFLLIDSRTGITEISGITLRILADEVVILSANNEENIYGTSRVIKKLTSQSEMLLNKPQRITFLITRLPFDNSVRDKFKEKKIVERRLNQVKQYTGIGNIEALVIHSDRRLEEDEQPLIGDEYDSQKVSISNDYLLLFDRLTSDVLAPDERTDFLNKKRAEKEFEKGITEKDENKKIIHFNSAIELNSNNHSFFIGRGQVYSKLKRFTEAISDFKYALKLNPQSNEADLGLANVYFQMNEYAKSIECIDSVLIRNPNDLAALNLKGFIYAKQDKLNDALAIYNLALQINPGIANFYNARANILREFGELRNAYSDIFRAIELDPDYGIYYATLAEIYLTENRIEEFYLNLSIALSKNVNSNDLSEVKDLYQKVRDEKRFIDLLDRYSIDITEIFGE